MLLALIFEKVWFTIAILLNNTKSNLIKKKKKNTLIHGLIITLLISYI